ncbi:DUF3053 domain-containing protein [Microbacteriaceae bacterium K1510]|nr:DUF3053 domain-containing protein [Microbacteriaceae bacterium K1510]
MSIISRIAAQPFTRRVGGLVLAALLALATAGCFDKEPEQRQAFIKFLQTRIIDKPGLHIPILSDQEAADIGPYAKHYNVMKGFHNRLDDSLSKDLRKIADASAPRSMEELRDKHAIVSALKRDMGTLTTELDKAEAEADAAHKALEQPADLKVVYDKAYEHMVTKPAQTFREILPIMTAGLPAIEELANYLDEHSDTVELHGNGITVKDAGARAKLASLIDAAAAAGKKSEEGKRKLRAMAEGR